jgi:PAS domain S-box-containing protein
MDSPQPTDPLLAGVLSARPAVPHDRTLSSIARLAGQLACLLASLILAGAALHPFYDAGLSTVAVVGRILIGATLLLAGSALWIRCGNSQPAARGTATAATAAAALNLVFSIGRAVLDPVPFSFGHSVVGAVSLHGAVAALAASAAILLLGRDREDAGRSAPVWLACTAIVVEFASLVAQVANVGVGDISAGSLGRDAVAACATVGLLLLGTAVFFLRPEAPPSRLLFGASRRAVLVRRLGVVALLAPAVFILTLIVVERGGIVSVSGGAAALTTIYVIVIFAVALFSLETIVDLTKQRQSMEETREAFTSRLQEQAAQLQETVAQRTLELRQANLHLKGLNGRLQLALRSSNYGVFELDIATGKLVWDERMREIYGVPPDYEVGSRDAWKRHIHPDDLALSAKRFENVLSGYTDAYDTEFRVVRPDGTIRHVESHGHLQRDAEGRPARIAGLNRDISTEKELQEALNVAEQRWQLAVLGANDAVWDWNIQSGFVFHDAHWAAMLGYDATEVGSSIESWRRLVHPDDIAASESAARSHIEERTPIYQCEYRMRSKAGDWRWILDRGKVVTRLPDGRALRMVGTHTDITPRKEMEHRLRRSEALADQVSRTALIGGWEIDVATSQLSWTAGVNRIYRLDEDVQLTLESALEYFPPEARDTLEAAIADARALGKAFDLELPVNTTGGGRAWVRMLGRTEMNAAGPVRVYGAIQDITLKHDTETSRRQLEAQLFHAQKMETLGTLAGGIAHDFNNLLTGIIGYHELAAESVPEDHPARACLDEARKASLRARELVEQILTFGRQSSGMGLESADIGLVVEEVRRFLRATLPANVTITTHVDPDCPHVKADTTQIHQVLLNLGSNAAHAMRAQGGQLTISLQRAEVNLDQAAALGGLPAGSYVRLSVADTGHGIDESTIQRIFDPFFTTKSTREGSGLGLAVVHGIVRGHNGSISVESTVGVGSKFHVYLPAVGEKRVAPEVDFSQAPDGAGERICIVDDEDIVVRSTKVALEKKGYQVRMFSSAEKCLEYLRGEGAACDALITDQTMPGMQGTELATAARGLIAGLPVVIMSGYFAKIPSRALDELGPVTLLAKPFTGSELAFRLHRALHPPSAS